MTKVPYDTYVEDSVILTYIHIILDTMAAIKLPYPVGKRDLDYNLYAEFYTVVANSRYIEVQWKNKQDVLHNIRFERTRFNLRWLNRLYFYFVPRLTTTDMVRAHCVLLLIYEHFCKETGAIKFDFGAVGTYKESLDVILALIYFRFFASQLSLTEFVSIYDPGNDKLSHESVLKISRYVDCMQRAAAEC